MALTSIDSETAPRNTLFECERCESLVETQRHRDQLVEPAFCPWCGQPVTSILGREIDGYRVERVLASGGFGIVYLASNVAQPRIKAVVKFLRPHWTYSSAELVQVFVEEARLTQEIGQTCWNVVNVLNVRENPWPHLMMEYIEGTTLDAVIARASDGGIPLRDAKGYLRGIAEALAATHKHDRVHRDLKPMNLMVIESAKVPEPERKIKLLDFGLAMEVATTADGAGREGEEAPKGVASPEDSPLSEAGTPEYMAPEAFDGVREVSLDIYAFGVAAFEILTGRFPWPQPPSSVGRVDYWRHVHRNTPPPAVRSLRPDVPKWLAAVVMRCLEKDPAERPATAAEVLRDLREPVPLWMKTAGVAALLAVGTLIFWLAATRHPDVSVAWEVDGATADENSGALYEGDLSLWLAPDQDLSARRLRLRVPGGKKITDIAASDDRIRCELIAGGKEARLRFSSDLQPGGDEVRLEGSGSDFRFRGTLTLREDSDPPVVEVPRLSAALGGGRLEPGVRLRPGGAELTVRVLESNLRRARLHLKAASSLQEDPDDLEREPIAPRARRKVADGWELTFSLDGVRPGRYDLQVRAEDKALGGGSERAHRGFRR